MASPVIFYQIWAFVAPGLYDEEKRHILPIAFLSAVFLLAAACSCYYIVFPFAFNFFHQLLHAGNCHYSQGKRLSEFRHKIADCLWADFRNAHFYPFSCQAGHSDSRHDAQGATLCNCHHFILCRNPYTA